MKYKNKLGIYFDITKNCFNMKIMKMKVKVCLENDLHADKTQNSTHI